MSTQPEALTPYKPDATDEIRQLHLGIDLQPSVTPETQAVDRDETIKRLLGTDYEFAKDSGLIDAFYVNPDTGADGLLHVLTGTVASGPNGAEIPEGFHHEPSSQDEKTFVDRSHLEGANRRERRRYKEFPFEPYEARVVIGGLQKLALRTTAEGERELAPSHSNMFPKEYDALTVLRTIARARETRDVANDKLDTTAQKIVTEGKAMMLDGETYMKLRLILDAKSEQVISAFPLRDKKNGAMKLQEPDIKRHLGLQ